MALGPHWLSFMRQAASPEFRWPEMAQTAPPQELSPSEFDILPDNKSVSGRSFQDYNHFKSVTYFQFRRVRHAQPCCTRNEIRNCSPWGAHRQG
jgi:hypothetical protein